jgi:hypothetical protein
VNSVVLLDVETKAFQVLQEFNDFEFHMKNSIEEARRILKEEMAMNQLSNCDFDRKVWIIEDNIEHTRRFFDFEEIIELIQFNNVIDKEKFVIVVKCWLSTFISNSSDILQSVYFRGFKNFLIVTKGLTVKETEDIKAAWDFIADRGKSDMCISALNFFNYCYDYDHERKFLDILIELKKELNFNTEIRDLPPSKEVLLFSKITEDYFSQDLPAEEYYQYFPIWLWWNITNLIPMRPSEFCKIKRNCLSVEDGIYYITLPRIKQKSRVKKFIQIVDKISIPLVLFEKIKEYIKKSELFGYSETLISYRAINNYSHEHLSKLNPDNFTSNILRIQLRKFYQNVIINQYNVYISEDENQRMKTNDRVMTQRINPGDTRHFAFLNLMRQGYHPVEIARLGGHTTLYAQYHYHQHTEYWVDTEVLQLIMKFNLNDNNQKNIGLSHVSNIHLNQSFKEKYVLQPPKTTTKIKLQDGYCTHPLQPCKVEDCWECDYWRISLEELQEKADVLEEKISKSKSQLEAMVSVLQNMYNAIYENSEDIYTNYDNADIHKNLAISAKNIDNAIRQYTNLAKVKERIDFYVEGEREKGKSLSTK